MEKQTTIIRAPRDKEHPYFSLRRKTAQDTRLSFEARGALVYLLSRPGNWDINLADLQREGGCGRDRALRILKELETQGYLIREKQTFGEKHRFNPVVLVVQEIPSTENPSTVPGSPSPENPITDDPITDGPITENTTHTEYKESQKAGSGESPVGVDQKTEESSTTTESVPPAREDVPPADVVVDGDDGDKAAWELIRTDIAALCLSPAMEIALRALGPAPALAIALAANKPGVKSPSGLAVSLINHPENIPQSLLDQAVARFVHHTSPDPSPDDGLAARRQEYERLQADTHRILEERMSPLDSGEPETKNDTLSILPGEADNGLDFTAGGLTIAEAWKMTLLNMQSQMGRETFNGYYANTEARSFRDGVLTLVPRNAMGRDMLSRYRRGWELEMTKLAGTPVTIEVAEVVR